MYTHIYTHIYVRDGGNDIILKELLGNRLLFEILKLCV